MGFLTTIPFRFNRVESAVDDRSDHLVEKYKKVVDFEANAEAMKETIGQLGGKVVSVDL